MSTIGKRTIWVGPGDGPFDKPLNVEGKSLTASILPGTVLEWAATGLQVNASAAIDHQTYLLVADKDQQRTKTVDDVWTISENMVAIQARSGEFLNVLVADSETLIKGTQLVRDGAGLLVAQSLETEEAIAVSDEAVVTSGTTLVRVRRTS